MASPFFLGVAFMRGSPRAWGDTLIMKSTGGPFVHTELFLQHGSDSRFYTSVDVPPGTFPCAIMPTGSRLPLSGDWETVRFPVSRRGYMAAYALLLELMSLPIPYNSRDLWQCAIKVMLPLERDLDCTRPATWVGPGVFCSQLCLLVLRRLAAQGHLAPPPGRIEPFFGSNSRGCSPNDLFRLLAPQTPGKKVGRNTACERAAHALAQSIR
jgi:hypothetical protein